MIVIPRSRSKSLLEEVQTSGHIIGCEANFARRISQEFRESALNTEAPRNREVCDQLRRSFTMHTMKPTSQAYNEGI